MVDTKDAQLREGIVIIVLLSQVIDLGVIIVLDRTIKMIGDQIMIIEIIITRVLHVIVIMTTVGEMIEGTLAQAVLLILGTLLLALGQLGPLDQVVRVGRIGQENQAVQIDM